MDEAIKRGDADTIAVFASAVAHRTGPPSGTHSGPPSGPPTVNTTDGTGSTSSPARTAVLASPPSALSPSLGSTRRTAGGSSASALGGNATAVASLSRALSGDALSPSSTTSSSSSSPFNPALHSAAGGVVLNMTRPSRSAVGGAAAVAGAAAPRHGHDGSDSEEDSRTPRGRRTAHGGGKKRWLCVLCEGRGAGFRRLFVCAFGRGRVSCCARVCFRVGRVAAFCCVMVWCSTVG